MTRAISVLVFLAGVFFIQSCYKIEPYTPDPDKVYVPGKRIKPQVEKDFVTNPSLRVQLGAIVVLQLEHFDSPASSLGPDTDSIGTDQIRYKVEDSTILVFRRDDNTSYALSFYIENQMIPLFNVQGPGEDIVIQLGPGNYFMKVFSQLPYGIDTVGYQMIFIQPSTDVGNTKGTQAGEPKYWYLTSRVSECQACDLAGLDLQGFNLMGADLQKANLSDTRLTGADLKTARIMHAKLNNAKINFADMKGINLSFSEVRNVDLSQSDLSYSILNATDLSFSKAYGTNFCFATKNGWVVNGMLTDTATQCFP